MTDLAFSEPKQTMGKLSSTERLRFISQGEVPNYFNALLRISSEQVRPMHACHHTTHRACHHSTIAPSLYGTPMPRMPPRGHA